MYLASRIVAHDLELLAGSECLLRKAPEQKLLRPVIAHLWQIVQEHFLGNYEISKVALFQKPGPLQIHRLVSKREPWIPR